MQHSEGENVVNQHVKGVYPIDQHINGIYPIDQHIKGVYPIDQHAHGAIFSYVWTFTEPPLNFYLSILHSIIYYKDGLQKEIYDTLLYLVINACLRCITLPDCLENIIWQTRACEGSR